jgi:RNA polymerase sigma-70 factor (ECF subfamily)
MMNKQQPPITDEQLLILIKQGDKKAFSLLMSRYLTEVISFAMRYFPQRSDAEDIAQETFTRLWCKAPDWQDKGVSVKAWLYRVAYNQSIDQLRKKKPEYCPEFDVNMIDETAFIDNLMDVDKQLAVQKIALETLPERQRTAIALCAIKGLSNKETASVMGISVEALESLLARGRRKLKIIYQLKLDQQLVKRETINDFY